MMELTKEHRMIRKLTRQFMEREVIPHIEKLEKKDKESRRLNREILRKMGRLGLLCPIIPKEYGGPGLDALSYAIIGEEVAKHYASLATTLGAHCSLCAAPILNYGTEEQKKELLPKLASGEYMGAFALTEPEAGSDASNVQTKAEFKDGVYYLRGSKQWITNGPDADVIIVIANANPSKGVFGITPFIVRTREAENFKVINIADTMGIRGSFQGDLVFDNTPVKEEDILGGKRNKGKGIIVTLETLNGGRVGVGAASVGLAQAAFEEAVKYAKTRVQFGKKISEFQGIQWMIAEMATAIESARWLVYRAAWVKEQFSKLKEKKKKEGLNPHEEELYREYKADVVKLSAMAKLYGSEVADKVVDMALQIHGGYGYMRDFSIERMYRDARIKRIYEGTSEIQKLVIANEVLKHFKV